MAPYASRIGNIDLWTKDKLEKVEAYLGTYLEALKKQNFQLEYIDAFAGTEFCYEKGHDGEAIIFEVDETVKLRDFIDGSAAWRSRQTHRSINTPSSKSTESVAVSWSGQIRIPGSRIFHRSCMW